jgi:hypothetical protein
MTKIRFEIRLLRHSWACEPCPSISIHLSRSCQKTDLDVFRSPLTGNSISGECDLPCDSPTAVFVSLFARTDCSGGTGDHRIDQCVVSSSESHTSTFGKFSVRVGGIASFAKKDGSLSRTIRDRSDDCVEAALDGSTKWSFELARACTQARFTDQPEGIITGEYYWYYQSQYKRHLSQEMHEQHLKLCLFWLGLSEEAVKESDMAEIVKEKLTLVAHTIKYVSDTIDKCSGSEVKSEVLLNQAPCHCTNKQLVDIASCPLDVHNHGMACGDCEDMTTVSFNQSFQDKSLAKRLKETSLLHRVLRFESNYVSCPVSVLVKNDESVSDEKLFEMNRPFFQKKYTLASDWSRFENLLTAHTTMVCIDTESFLAAVSGKGHKGEKPFLVESTIWTTSSSAKKKTPFDRRWHKFAHHERFRRMTDSSEWYFVVSAVFSEEIRRRIGCGAYRVYDSQRESYGILMSEFLNNKNWISGRIRLRRAESKCSDEEFADACHTLSEIEGATFLPKETTFGKSLHKPASNRIDVLSVSKEDWESFKDEFDRWIGSLFKYSVTEWTVSEGITRIVVEILPP